MRLTLAFVVAALVLSSTSVEARGPRGMRQRYYSPYYYNNYNTVPTYNTVNTVVPATTTPVTTSTSTTTSASETIVQTNAIEKKSDVVQASGTDDKATSEKPASPAKPATYVFANTIAGATANLASPGTAPAGSAQWKAEQSARMGSVAHIGGGFGGGSYEGNGYGFTPEHAIQNACFWGQRTPLEIGVARGYNGGYYATIFYY